LATRLILSVEPDMKRQSRIWLEGSQPLFYRLEFWVRLAAEDMADVAFDPKLNARSERGKED